MLSAGMFGKEKKAQTDIKNMDKSEEKFDLTFTYGFALVSNSDQAICEQVTDLAEEIWKLHKTDGDEIQVNEQSFIVHDKSISRLHDRDLSLSKVEELSRAHEKNYNESLPKLEKDASEAQWEAFAHRTKTTIQYFFKIELKNKAGNSLLFQDFEDLQRYTYFQQPPCAQQAKRPRR